MSGSYEAPLPQADVDAETKLKKFLRERRERLQREEEKAAGPSDGKTAESPPAKDLLPDTRDAKTTPVAKRQKLDGGAARNDGGASDGDSDTQEYLPRKAQEYLPPKAEKRDDDPSDPRDQETQDQDQEAQDVSKIFNSQPSQSPRQLSSRAGPAGSAARSSLSPRAGPAGGAAGSSVPGMNGSLWSVLPDENAGDYQRSVAEFKELLLEVPVSSLSAKALKHIHSAQETIDADEDPRKHGGTAWLCLQWTQKDEKIREAETEKLAPELEERERLRQSLAFCELRIKNISDEHAHQHDKNTAEHAKHVRTRQKELLPVVHAAVSELQAKKASRVPGTFDSFV